MIETRTGCFYQLNEIVELFSEHLTPEAVDLAVEELHSEENVTVLLGQRRLTVLDRDEGYVLAEPWEGWRRVLDGPKRNLHGERACYRAGCHCTICTEANRLAVYSSRAKVDLSRMPRETHGTPNGYAYWGCRCPSCTEAAVAAARSSPRRKRR